MAPIKVPCEVLTVGEDEEELLFPDDPEAVDDELAAEAVELAREETRELAWETAEAVTAEIADESPEET